MNPRPAGVRVLATLAILSVAGPASSPVFAQAADVVAIQAREARNADQRTLAALERFREALVARYGGDPKLTMLVIGESEGTALVDRPAPAPPEFVIRRGDAWVGTENRQLRVWASPAVAAANAFPLSSVRAASFRAWLDAWRKASGHATDFVTNYEVGHDPAARRVVVRALVGSMATGKLALQRFDPATGAAIEVPASR